ncbi:MAG: hypothetical protein ABI769_12985 [Pseudomonadota bacterium]
MARIRHRLVGGEILEVSVGTKYGYVQFIGSHPKHGDAILVNPALHARQARFASGFFSGGYVTFYPAGNAVARKIVEVVAQSSPPKVPKRFRRPGAVGRDGTVESWVIEGGWRDVVKRELSDEERSIPIAGVWNHELLSKQLASGWTPATDGR